MKQMYVIGFSEIQNRIKKKGADPYCEVDWHDVTYENCNFCDCITYGDFFINIRHKDSRAELVEEAILEILKENGVINIPNYVIVEND